MVINAILREFVMSKVSSDSMMNADKVIDLLRPELGVTKEDVELFVKPNDQRQTRLGYGMERKGRM